MELTTKRMHPAQAGAMTGWPADVGTWPDGVLTGWPADAIAGWPDDVPAGWPTAVIQAITVNRADRLPPDLPL